MVSINRAITKEKHHHWNIKTKTQMQTTFAFHFARFHFSCFLHDFYFSWTFHFYGFFEEICVTIIMRKILGKICIYFFFAEILRFRCLMTLNQRIKVRDVLILCLLKNRKNRALAYNKGILIIVIRWWCLSRIDCELEIAFWKLLGKLTEFLFEKIIQTHLNFILR